MTAEMDALTERQIGLEQAARDRGIARFSARFEAAQRRERGNETPGGIYLLKRSVAPLSAAIDTWIKASLAGNPGHRATAAVLLEGIDPDLLAYCTMTSILSGAAVYKRRRLQSLAVMTATGIDHEVRMAAFEKQQPTLYNTIMNRLADRKQSISHVEKVMVASLGKYDIDAPAWTASQKLHIGMALVGHAIEVTGLFEIQHVAVTRRKRSVPTVAATAALVGWLQDRNEKLAIISPVVAPMVIPPRPWRSLYGGGYRSDAIMRVPIVKRMTKEHGEALKAADLTTTYAGLNAIAGTGWRVNGPVLDVALALWERGDDLEGMPSRMDQPLPDKPWGKDEQPDQNTLTAWKRSARDVWDANVAARSGRLQAMQIMRVAEDLREEVVYFPHNVDFRGRCYARPAALNPQGNDLCRGLLRFAEGKPLGDERAVGWLAIHGANCFGVDKVSHDDRIAWVYEHEYDIKVTARHPLGATWWQEADAPWSFLAFCFEWTRYTEEGLSYASSIPIAMDGSCNGLQHYSAMLRDPVGGAAVNLLPADKPEDIYGRVAEEVVRRLAAIAADPEDPNAWVAQSWIDFGIDRKTTKRQVMVLPYGGTRNSCIEYTRQAVREKIAGGKDNPFGLDLPRQSAWLGGVIWDSIGGVVIKAREAMTWLREVARVAANAGVPLQWTTPSGFVARQAYPETKSRRVKTRFRGTLVVFDNHQETGKLDKARQATGIAPNFVHSLDASAMMLTIELGLTNGVNQFAMIHDSYGTVAADTDVLAACLRHAFVDMYQEHDVLARFRDEIAATLPPEAVAKLPPLPSAGTLDLSQVLESAFFFT